MRIVQTVPARPMYYDREVINQSIRFDASNISPHSITLRATYTVPSGKKAMLEFVTVGWRRISIASTPGSIWLYVQYIPSAGEGTYLYRNVFVTNDMSICVNDVVTNFGVMKEGDKIEFYTADNSSGGTCSYLFNAKIFEFTA